MRLIIDFQAYQSPESRIRGIGRYSQALTRAIVEHSGRHECLVALNGAIAGSVEPSQIALGDLLPAGNIRSWASLGGVAELSPGGAARNAVAGELFRQAMRELRPDFLHIGSLFEGWGNDVANVVGLPGQGLPTAVTLYDFIPFEQPDVYLADPLVRAWYMRRFEQLKQAELLLSISAFTKARGIDLLGMDPGRIVNIRGACDAMFRRISLDNEQRLVLHQRYGIVRPYVMYTGGFDPHKNIVNLLRAFAALPADIRQVHQLLIVGSPPANERMQLEKLRHDLGLSESDCVLCGYVSDQDLVALYNDCRLYAFPSLQEGFGLPALEAMACGTVVVGSNVSSLPEVIDFADAQFDPRSLHAITTALQRGLCDEGFRHAFLEHARNQVRRFSWEESARRAWEGLEAAHERQHAAQTVRVSYVGTTKAAAQLAGKWPGYVDQSRATAEQLSNEDTPSCFVIADAASALTAWQVMRRRTIAVLLSDGLSLPQAVRSLHAQPEGKAMLDFILADQGAYALALQEGDVFFARLAATVETWMERVAAQVVHAKNLANAELTELALHRCGREHRVREAVARMLALPQKPERDDGCWKDVAEAIHHNRQVDNGHGGRWLIDISQLAEHDAWTGVQRVVRNLLRHFLLTPPEGVQILPIHFDYRDGSCRYARRFTWKFLGLPSIAAVAEDEIVDWLPGDRLIGLDLSAHIIPPHQAKFVRWRDLGVQMDIVLYDMLANTRPDCFESGMVDAMRRWYRSIGELADGVICISLATAYDFVNWLDQAKPERAHPIKVGYFHLGADPEKDHSSELDHAGKKTLEKLADRPTVLMVSTVEPRKGYQQALEAFELLWQRGAQVNLAIVGKAGWHAEHVIERLRHHPEAGQRLYWFEGASDALLHALYKQCDLLLSASEGEGFGLPVIEAAQYGIPLLLRDLSVFREIAGEHAKYFAGYEPEALAEALQVWHERMQRGLGWPDSNQVPWLTWEQSYRQFVDVVEGRRWGCTVGFTSRYWFPSCDPRMQTQCGEYRRGKLYSRDVEGMLIYGPYAKVIDGVYRLRAYGTVDQPDDGTWLDVAIESGQWTLFKSNLEPDGGGVLLETTLVLPRTVQDLEIRVWTSGQSRLRLDGFELLRQESA